MDSKPRTPGLGACSPTSQHGSRIPALSAQSLRPGVAQQRGNNLPSVGFALRAVGRPVFLMHLPQGRACDHARGHPLLQGWCGLWETCLPTHTRAHTGQASHPAPGTVGVLDVHFLQFSQERVPVPTDCFFPTLGPSGSEALRVGGGLLTLLAITGLCYGHPS